MAFRLAGCASGAGRLMDLARMTMEGQGRIGSDTGGQDKHLPFVEPSSRPEFSNDAQRLSLRRNFLWTATGNVVYAGCQWGMLMALAKLGSPEMVGQFALGLAIGAPVMMFANLQLRTVLGTDVCDDFSFGEYWGLRLITSMVAVMVIALIAVASGHRQETVLVVVVVGIAKSVESISDLMYGLFQKYERLDRIAIALILKGMGSVVFFALAIWVTRKVVWAATALAGWWVVVLYLYEAKTASGLLSTFGKGDDRMAPSWGLPHLWKLAQLSFPLGLVTVLSSLNTNIPRYFVAGNLGEKALGYFAALAYVMVAGSTVMSALGLSAAPRLARYYLSNRPAYIRLLGKMLVLAIVLGVGGVVLAEFWGAEILSFFYRPDYAAYQPIFVSLTLASGLAFIASVLGTGMTSARIYRPQVPLTLAATLATLIVCWLGFSSYGLFSAAYALMAGAVVLVVGSALVLAATLTRVSQPPEGPITPPLIRTGPDAL